MSSHPYAAASLRPGEPTSLPPTTALPPVPSASPSASVGPAANYTFPSGRPVVSTYASGGEAGGRAVRAGAGAPSPTGAQGASTRERARGESSPTLSRSSQYGYDSEARRRAGSLMGSSMGTSGGAAPGTLDEGSPGGSTRRHRSRLSNASPTSTSPSASTSTNAANGTHEPAPRSPPVSSKSVLTIALQRAQSAVLLDSANNVPAAIAAYGQSVRLLKEVMVRQEDNSRKEKEREREKEIEAVRRGETDEEREKRKKKAEKKERFKADEARRLRVIHDTYEDRIAMLVQMEHSPTVADQSDSTYAPSPSQSSTPRTLAQTSSPPVTPHHHSHSASFTYSTAPSSVTSSRHRQTPSTSSLSNGRPIHAGVASSDVRESQISNLLGVDQSLYSSDGVSPPPSPMDPMMRAPVQPPPSFALPSLPSIDTGGRKMSLQTSTLSPLGGTGGIGEMERQRSQDNGNVARFPERQPVPVEVEVDRDGDDEREEVEDLPEMAGYSGALPAEEELDSGDESGLDPSPFGQPSTVRTSRVAHDDEFSNPSSRSVHSASTSISHSQHSHTHSLSSTQSLSQRSSHAHSASNHSFFTPSSQAYPALPQISTTTPFSDHSTSRTAISSTPAAPSDSESSDTDARVPVTAMEYGVGWPRDTEPDEDPYGGMSLSPVTPVGPTPTDVIGAAMGSGSARPRAAGRSASLVGSTGIGIGRPLVSSSTSLGTISQRRRSPRSSLVGSGSGMARFTADGAAREDDETITTSPMGIVVRPASTDETEFGVMISSTSRGPTSAPAHATTPSYSSATLPARFRALSQPGKRPSLGSFDSAPAMPTAGSLGSSTGSAAGRGLNVSTSTSGMQFGRKSSVPTPTSLFPLVRSQSRSSQSSVSERERSGLDSSRNASPVPPPYWRSGSTAGGDSTPLSATFHKPAPLSLTTITTIPPPPPELFVSVSALRRPFSLMRNIVASVEQGGYVTPRLYIPRQMWWQTGVKLAAVETKVRALDALLTGLEAVERAGAAMLGSEIGGDRGAAARFAGELEVFEGMIDSIQSTLAKKLGYGPSGKKNSATSFSAWSSKLSRSLDRVTNGRSLDSPVVYIEGIARVFKQAQSLDAHVFAMQDVQANYSSLRPEELSRIEQRLRRASEFFGQVIVQFVLRDLGVLLDKYVKKGSTADF
ncbi:hypothetical protein MNV49_001483 [Pseudohyphozyma bogoriensis]|nr:hypothetical protein MNV49_001483 [Pseudohyphozyma bogoriensis]